MLNELFNTQLGLLGSVCRNLMERITKLQAIELKSKKFGSIAFSPALAKRFSTKGWRKAIGKKLKFGFHSYDILHTSLEEMTKFNGRFRLLSRQVILHETE